MANYDDDYENRKRLPEDCSKVRRLLQIHPRYKCCESCHSDKVDPWSIRIVIAGKQYLTCCLLATDKGRKRYKIEYL